MKRVLIVCNTLYGGGAEAVLQTVLNNINIKKQTEELEKL